MWLFLLFIAVPLIEIALFIQVGGAIGLFPTLAIVILTAMLGTYMIRTQGADALLRLRKSLDELRNPAEPLAHGAMILFAGALLLTPGFFTDTVGFLLLIPAVRDRIYAYLRSRMTAAEFTVHTGQTHRDPAGGSVIDGEFEVLGDDPGHGPSGASGWTRH